MSEIGLFASSYKRLNEYARSVDRLLLDLNSETPPREETAAPVIALLETVQNEEAAAPSVQLLRLRWKHRAGLTTARVDRMISELRTQKVSSQTAQDLEELARLLDQERADMRFRLRGA